MIKFILKNLFRFTALQTALLTLFLGLATACQKKHSPFFKKQAYIKGEYIYRMEQEKLFLIPPPQPQPPPLYSWHKQFSTDLPLITKEYFRCKGSSLNPLKLDKSREDISYISDCGGAEKHSLPLKEDKEFIYPILIDLLNHLQNKTKKKVIITSGHRCPEHNTYVDSSKTNLYSKHMIGAEVSFYIQGMEHSPQLVIKEIQNYYIENPKYQNQKEFLEFERYTKDDSHVQTPPWMNKEIFIKLYTKNEGRNHDNRHPYPYIAIQVRYDTEKKERVIYTWDKAQHNFLRK